MERWGERIALDTPGLILSYREFAAAAQVVAARLRDGGVGPGDRVGVRVPSGTTDLYVAILGVLMAGAAYVPVAFTDPDSRVETVFTKANVSAVVGEGLEVSWRARGDGRPTRPGPDDDAWIIFHLGLHRDAEERRGDSPLRSRVRSRRVGAVAGGTR